MGKAALARGLKPNTISTDLHNRSLDTSVWDLATTMSKLFSLGMTMEDVIVASFTAPKRAIGKPADNLLSKGMPAYFALFDLVDGDLVVTDSQDARSTLHQTFEPRYAILGAEAVAAHRHQPITAGAPGHKCPSCGWTA